MEKKNSPSQVLLINALSVVESLRKETWFFQPVLIGVPNQALRNASGCCCATAGKSELRDVKSVESWCLTTGTISCWVGFFLK